MGLFIVFVIYNTEDMYTVYTTTIASHWKWFNIEIRRNKNNYFEFKKIRSQSSAKLSVTTSLFNRRSFFENKKISKRKVCDDVHTPRPCEFLQFSVRARFKTWVGLPFILNILTLLSKFVLKIISFTTIKKKIVDECYVIFYIH